MTSLHLHSPTLKVKLDYFKKTTTKQLFKTTNIKTAHTQYENAKCHSAKHITLHTPTLKQAQLNICSEELHMRVLQKLSRRSHYRARYASRTRSQGRKTEGKSLIPLMRRGWLGGGTSLSLGKTAKYSCEKSCRTESRFSAAQKLLIKQEGLTDMDFSFLQCRLSLLDMTPKKQLRGM